MLAFLEAGTIVGFLEEKNNTFLKAQDKENRHDRDVQTRCVNINMFFCVYFLMSMMRVCFF